MTRWGQQSPAIRRLGSQADAGRQGSRNWRFELLRRVWGHGTTLFVAEAPDRFITAWDDETDASGARLIATQDAVILGRRSYDEWAEFWPGSEIQPFASFINAVPKYVVDELRLVIAPTIVGSGQRLFDGLPPLRLETIRGTASSSGHVLVDYRVVR